MVRKLGRNIQVEDNVVFGGSASIGHCSCVGFGGTGKTYIGENALIGAFCLIAEDVTIERDVEIDHYCRIDKGSRIGQMTRILYGTQVFEGVSIGPKCIIGGDLIDRAVVEDNVTYMGRMAHSYRIPGTIEDWDTFIQPSPVIRRGTVVGENALLIGGITIGPNSYIAAGEVVRSSIPPKTVLFKGRFTRIETWRGMIQTRT